MTADALSSAGDFDKIGQRRPLPIMTGRSRFHVPNRNPAVTLGRRCTTTSTPNYDLVAANPVH